MAGKIKAAIWSRVSTAEQSTENQDLRAWAERRGVEVAAEFSVHDSAWTAGNGKGREFDAARAELLEGARQGHYQVVLIWALDRWTRRGIRDATHTLEQIWDTGCDVWSQQEPFIDAPSEFRPLMIAMFAWMAEQESRRRSTRTQAGLKRRKERDGLPIGRQPGAQDKAKRKRSGYVSAWEGPAGAARRAALAERNRARARSKAEAEAK
jgi:DNA invertase Pin-like site-specific DNA recombinase